MARKVKALPKFEEWKAQWEVDADGNDIPEDQQEFDAKRAKKLIYDLLSDKNRGLNQVAELTEAKEELEKQVADVKPEDLEKLKSDLATAQRERDEAKQGSGLEALKYRVALRKGLTESQAKRLVGATEEELEEDADELIKTFGGKTKTRSKSDDDDDDDDDDEPPVARGPRNRFNNPGDPDPDKGKSGKEPTPEDIYKRYKALV